MCDVAEVVVNVGIDPSLDDPDLFPNYTFGRTTFSQGENTHVIININETSNNASLSSARFFVPNSSGFDFEFDPLLSQVDIFGTQEVHNSTWTATTFPTGILFETDEYIEAGSRSRIALKVNAITPGTKANLTVNIAQGSGGETNEVNNIAVLSISIQN